MDFDHCGWPGCREESIMTYAVEGKVGLCQKHEEAFFTLQETKGDAVARAKIGLSPRKGPPWSAADRIAWNAKHGVKTPELKPAPLVDIPETVVTPEPPEPTETPVHVTLPDAESDAATLSQLPASIAVSEREEEAAVRPEQLIRVGPRKRIRRFE